MKDNGHLGAYMEGLKRMENYLLVDAPSDTIVMPNKPPEDTDTRDLAWGHKITEEEEASGEIYGIPFNNGITKAEAEMILEADIIKHGQLARAKVGQKVWNELPQAGKDLLVDYSITGTLHKFPKMFLGIANKNKGEVVKEMTRKYTEGGELKPMKTRNAFGMEMIEAMGSYWK